MTEHTPDIIVVGASAGGVEALRTLVAGFPEDLDAAVIIVLHTLPTARSVLAKILSRAGKLPAISAEDQLLLETGKVYVAPPDRHTLLHDGVLRVIRGPKENRHRPSIDVLFRSAAMAHCSSTIGVLLSGADDDGAAGLLSIKQCGGTTVIQNPAEAQYPEMPQAAQRAVGPDFTLPIAEIGPVLAKLVAGTIPPPEKEVMSEPIDKSFGGDEGVPADVRRLGTPSAFTCPDCNGTLWELQDGDLVRYRCRVGHAYSPESMMEAEADAVERALWSAVRSLEESAAVSRRIAEKTGVLREDLNRKAEEREQHARVIRKLLLESSG